MFVVGVVMDVMQCGQSMYLVVCCLQSDHYCFPGDGESVKDPSEEKPKSETEGVDEPVVGEESESVDSEEDAQKNAEEHVEL